MTTYYVAPPGSGGNDTTGDGAIGTPWATYSKALDTIASVSGAGRHTVQFRAGTYGGANKSRNNLIIENYPGEDVVFSGAVNSRSEVLMFSDASSSPGGSNVLIRKNPSGGSFKVTDGGYGSTVAPGALIIVYNDTATSPSDGFCIDGLELDTNRSKWHNLAGEAGYGVRLYYVSNGYIANCNIHGGASGLMGECIAIQHNSSYYTINNNLLHDCLKMINDEPVGNGGNGLELASGDHYTVYENEFYNLRAPSVGYGYDGGSYNPFSIADSEFHHNIHHDSVGVWESGYDGTHVMARNWVHHEVIYGKMNYNSPAESAVFYLRGDRDSTFENLTIDVDDGYDVFRYLDDDSSQYTNPSPSNQNLVVRNNLIISGKWHLGTDAVSDPSETLCYDFLQGLPGSLDAANTGVIFDYNILWNTTGSSGVVAAIGNGTGGNTKWTRTQLATFQAASAHGDHDVWASDPTSYFVNRANHDYHLTAGSPAISGASDGGDIGAFDYIPATIGNSLRLTMGMS